MKSKQDRAGRLDSAARIRVGRTGDLGGRRAHRFRRAEPDFIPTYLPELTGVQVGDDLVLRISFDPGAEFLGEFSWPDGGSWFFHDGTSLVLELTILGRGTHVFLPDDTLPPGFDPRRRL